MSLGRYLRVDHLYCLGLVELIEPLAQSGEWSKAEQACVAFESAFEQHVQREERILFPALEEAKGEPMALIREMRAEHTEMRDLVSRIRADLRRCDARSLAAAADRLRSSLQRHQKEEEGSLYPMADRILAEQANELLQRMDGWGAFARSG